MVILSPVRRPVKAFSFLPAVTRVKTSMSMMESVAIIGLQHSIGNFQTSPIIGTSEVINTPGTLNIVITGTMSVLFSD